MPFVGLICLLVASLACFEGTTGNVRDNLVADGIQRTSIPTRVIPTERAARKACKHGVVIGATSGQVATPGFSKRAKYPSDANCEWIIRAAPGKIVRMVVRFADIPCPDSLAIFNYEAGYDGYHLTTVCGPKQKGGDTVVYSDTDGAVVTFRSFPGLDKTGRGFRLTYTIVDQDEIPCGVPRIAPYVPGISDGTGEGSIPLPPGPLFPPAPTPPILHIIGGVEAVPFSWPWHAGLALADWIFVTGCGAVILNQRWVVTAAHCLNEDPIPLSWLVVALGAYDLETDDEPTRQLLDIERAIIHPGFDNRTLNNDIGLVKVTENIRFSPQVSPVCLPTKDVPANTICVATGWGAGTEDNEYLLHQVELPIIDQEVCREPKWHGPNVTDNMVCAGYTEGEKDTCAGDSGGPLVCKEDGHWVLHGLTSWGEGSGCGEPYNPGVYARVSKFVDWIEETMAEN